VINYNGTLVMIEIENMMSIILFAYDVYVFDVMMSRTPEFRAIGDKQDVVFRTEFFKT